jgi:hypothetical protein
MYLVVGCVGLPAAFRNPTAAFLCLSWIVGEVTYLVTGNNLPFSIYLIADVTVVTSIYIKTVQRVGVKTYPTLKNQFYSLVTDLTMWDRLIVALFLLGVWPVYAMNLHPYYTWLLLWGLTIAQFFCAGAEAIHVQSLRHKLARDASEPPDGFALAGFRSYG